MHRIELKGLRRQATVLDIQPIGVIGHVVEARHDSTHTLVNELDTQWYWSQEELRDIGTGQIAWREAAEQSLRRNACAGFGSAKVSKPRQISGCRLCQRVCFVF